MPDDETEIQISSAPARSWSAEQEAIFAAFANPAGHFVVEALAGTGKTTTAAEGLSRAPEAKKVYLAFNRSIVEEAKGKMPAGVEVKSFHSLGFQYVLRQWKGVKPDGDCEIQRFKKVMASREFSRFARGPRASILATVSFAKNTAPFAATPADLEAVWFDARVSGELSAEEEQEGWTIDLALKAAAQILADSKVRNKDNTISFDDMLYLPLVMRWAAPWFDLVVADEAQDLNASQQLLIERACKASGRIVLIGDPNQAIYEFRGATTGSLKAFVEKHACRTYGLTTTYRCPRAVVELAAKIVPAYKAAPSAPEGLVEYLGDQDLTALAQPGDAVLGRTNAPLVATCMSFLRNGVRAYVEGRDVGRELRAIVKKIQASNIEAFLVLLGKWEAAQVLRIVAADKNVEVLVSAVQDKAAVLRAVAEVSDDVADLDRRLNVLFDDSDKKSDPRPSVVCSTVHRAKGREFDTTFVLTDSFRNMDFAAGDTSEHRVLYVCVTRAKKRLVFARTPGGAPQKSAEKVAS